VGHIRLGELPRTKKWRDVVALIGEGTATPQEMVLAINKVADDRLRPLKVTGHSPIYIGFSPA